MSQTDSDRLAETSVAVLVAPAGTEHVEYERPTEALEDAGADVTVVGSETGEAQTVENDLEDSGTVEVEAAAGDVSADEYDALVLPGGTVGADRLRADEDVVEFVREHLLGGGPTAAICHGPWLLVEADELEGRTLTSFPSLETDVENAGGNWVDRQVVTDETLVTSRTPDDLDAFCEELVETFDAAD